MIKIQIEQYQNNGIFHIGQKLPQALNNSYDMVMENTMCNFFHRCDLRVYVYTDEK